MANEYTREEEEIAVALGYDFIETIPDDIRERYLRGDKPRTIANDVCVEFFPVKALDNFEGVIDLFGLAVEKCLFGNKDKDLGKVYKGLIPDGQRALMELDSIDFFKKRN